MRAIPMGAMTPRLTRRDLLLRSGIVHYCLGSTDMGNRQQRSRLVWLGVLHVVSTIVISTASPRDDEVSRALVDAHVRTAGIAGGMADGRIARGEASADAVSLHRCADWNVEFKRSKSSKSGDCVEETTEFWLMTLEPRDRQLQGFLTRTDALRATYLGKSSVSAQRCFTRQWQSKAEYVVTVVPEANAPNCGRHCMRASFIRCDGDCGTRYDDRMFGELRTRTSAVFASMGVSSRSLNSDMEADMRVVAIAMGVAAVLVTADLSAAQSREGRIVECLRECESDRATCLGEARQCAPAGEYGAGRRAAASDVREPSDNQRARRGQAPQPFNPPKIFNTQSSASSG